MQTFTGHWDEEEVTCVQRVKQEHQKLSGSEKLCEKAREAELTKAAAKKKKEKLVAITCFNCGKKGHFSSKYPEAKKDKESIGNDGTGVD